MLSLSLLCVSTQQEGSHLPTRKSALTRPQSYWDFGLRIPASIFWTWIWLWVTFPLCSREENYLVLHSVDSCPWAALKSSTGLPKGGCDEMESWLGGGFIALLPRHFLFFHTGYIASGYCHSWLPWDWLLSWDCFAYPNSWPFKLSWSCFPSQPCNNPQLFEEHSLENVCFSLTRFSLLEQTEKQKRKEERGPCSISLIKLPKSGLSSSGQFTTAGPGTVMWLVRASLVHPLPLLKFLPYAKCSYCYVFKIFMVTLKDISYWPHLKTRKLKCGEDR